MSAFVEAAGAASRSTLVVAELRQLGGGFATPPRPGGVFDRTDAAFAYVGVGLATPDTIEHTRADLERVATLLGPWETGTVVPGLVENPQARQHAFNAAASARLDAVRRSTDAEGLFDDSRPVARSATLVG